MAEDRADKIVIIATHGAEDPERATLPFVVANAAQAMDTEAVVILQGYAVTLAMPGTYEHVFAAGLHAVPQGAEDLGGDPDSRLEADRRRTRRRGVFGSEGDVELLRRQGSPPQLVTVAECHGSRGLPADGREVLACETFPSSQ